MIGLAGWAVVFVLAARSTPRSAHLLPEPTVAMFEERFNLGHVNTQTGQERILW
jgi:hypothetical protein